MIEDLSYFVVVDFRLDAPGHRKSISPHVTKQVRLPQGGAIIFPLKKHYDSVNFTCEGVSVSQSSGGVDCDLPEYADDDPYQSGEDPTDIRDQGGADPTVDADAATTREEPFE